MFKFILRNISKNRIITYHAEVKYKNKNNNVKTRGFILFYFFVKIDYINKTHQKI